MISLRVHVSQGSATELAIFSRQLWRVRHIRGRERNVPLTMAEASLAVAHMRLDGGWQSRFVFVEDEQQGYSLRTGERFWSGSRWPQCGLAHI